MLVRGLAEALASAGQDVPNILKVRMRRFRGHVVLQPGLVIQPLREGIIRGAGRIQGTGADENDWGLRIPEAELGAT